MVAVRGNQSADCLNPHSAESVRGERKKFFLFPPKPAAAVGVSVTPLSFAERDGTAGFQGSLNAGLLEMVEEKTFIGIDFPPLLFLCISLFRDVPVLTLCFQSIDNFR